jgi:hypothetical protein
MRIFLILGAALVAAYLIWRYGNSAADSGSSGFDLVGTSDGGFTAVSNSDVNPNPGTDAYAIWADAIFHHEGGQPGDRNVRNNNPGNLKFAGQAGAVGQDAEGFAIFSDMISGFAALQRQLKKYVSEFPHFSILQIMTRYLGGNPLDPQVTKQGDPFAYANDVASKLGVGTGSTLGNVFGG